MSHARDLLVRFVLVGLFVVGLGAPPSEAQGVIKIGNLVDLTGPTSDQGKDIAQGRIDAVQYFNERGGVNGRKIELVSVEYGFQPPRAVAAYKRFVEDDKVVMVLGYGTPDTEALRPYITKDKIPYLSGSYSGHLTDPRQTPYNFPGGIDYTSQIRIFLNYVKDTWTDTSRKPRVAFIFADNAYGRAPIEAGRGYAKEIGVDLVDEEIIPTVLTDATSQLLTMKKKDPDYAYINTNTQWVPVVLKDSYKLGLKTKYVVNNYGIDERTPKLAAEAAEGVMGIQDVAYWGENVPGMKVLTEFHQKHHPGDTHASPYMRGWLWVIMSVEAIKRAGDNPTGESIKKALESLKDFDTWGITPPFSYTNEDHRPTNRARLVAKLLEDAGRQDVPVVAGASGQFIPSPQCRLGDGFKSPSLLPVKAEDFLHSEINRHAGKVVILAIGQLTNVAELLKKYPEDAKKIKQIAMEWIKHFDSYTAPRTLGEYRLLIFDGHNSHCSFEFVSFCQNNKIIPLCLPPHSTHELQPLDVGVFGPLAKEYRALVSRKSIFGAQRISNLDFLLLQQPEPVFRWRLRERGHWCDLRLLHQSRLTP